MTASLGFKVRDAVGRPRTAHSKLKKLRTAGLGKPRQKPKHFSRSRRAGLCVTDTGAAGRVFGRGFTTNQSDVNTGGHDGR